MEYRDILNRQKEPLGYTKERSQPLEDFEYVRVAGVLVISQAKLLVTRRAECKTFPHKWEFTMGSVQAGETALQGAVRELAEEVGIICQAQELTYLGSMRHHPRFSEVYLLRRTIDRVTMQEEEVEAYKFIDSKELKAMIARGDFSKAMERRISHFYPKISKYID